MIYLKSFKLLSESMEHYVSFRQERRNIFNNYYPLGIFTSKQFCDIEFDNITIFYGGNGSLKTTLLNIISERLKASRISLIDKGSFFYKYVNSCTYESLYKEPFEISLITSDDVFDYLLDIRAINIGVNRKKEHLSNEYLNSKYDFGNVPFDDYEKLK